MVNPMGRDSLIILQNRGVQTFGLLCVFMGDYISPLAPTERKLNRLLRNHYMEGSSVIRMWITNKNNREITTAMSESMVCFLSIAIENGCIGSTFAEDDERIIVYTRWSDEMTLEQFRSSKEYHTQEGKIIQSFTAAGFEIPDDILFNSTAKILFSDRLESIQ